MKSIRTFFRKKIVENVLLIFLLLGVTINVFTPNLPLLQRSADLANQTMLFYFAISIFFLLFNLKRLMITSMMCTAIFAFYLKESTNSRIKYAPINLAEKFRLSLINLSSIDSDPSKVISTITKKSYDLMIFQEFTPNWKSLIEENLSPDYPNSISLPRIDVYGLKILSKFPIVYADTFHYEEIPILHVDIQKNGSKFSILTAYFPPPIDNGSIEVGVEELKLVADRINKIQNPLIVAGVFNMVPWSTEIQGFKETSKLIDSRSGYIPSMYKNSGGIFGKPVTHIFYRQTLECTNFNISRADNDEYGIEAFFQCLDSK